MNYLNLHIVQSMPFSNLNRDDTGAPKTMNFGGTQRARLSSQSLKRAARTNFEAGSPADRTSRSKMSSKAVFNAAVDMLTQSGVELDDAQRAELEILSGKEMARLTAKDAADTDTLVWLAEKEVADAAAKVASSVTGEELGEYVTSRTDSLTISGFGRMFANRPDLQTDAAVQVAHAFTTHEIEIELDYFTAVDDLRASFTEDAGAGHLDLAEAISGTFYRYLNIDRRQLIENWSGASAEDASERLASFFESLVWSLPNGKINSTAAHTAPALILVETAEQGLSFAPAFENRIDGREGFDTASVAALLDYADRARLMAPSSFDARRVSGMAVVGNDDWVNVDDLVQFCADWALS